MLTTQLWSAQSVLHPIPSIAPNGNPLVQCVRPVSVQFPIKALVILLAVGPDQLAAPEWKSCDCVAGDRVMHVEVGDASIALGIVDIDDLAEVSAASAVVSATAADGLCRWPGALRVRSQVDRLGKGVVDVELQRHGFAGDAGSVAFRDSCWCPSTTRCIAMSTADRSSGRVRCWACRGRESHPGRTAPRLHCLETAGSSHRQPASPSGRLPQSTGTCSPSKESCARLKL